MIEANPSTPDPILTRKNILLRSIEYYTKQANRAAIELQELLGIDGNNDDTQPLVITGNGEYAGIIEAKPNGVKS